jgi:hypothetical protein
VAASGIWDRNIFPWEWHGRPVKIAYETLGVGAPVLLPAFSTVFDSRANAAIGRAPCRSRFRLHVGRLAPALATGHGAGSALDPSSIATFSPTSLPQPFRGERRWLRRGTPPPMPSNWRVIGPADRRDAGHR